jgi:hypothetical protein
MTKDEAIDVIEQLRKEGYSYEDILTICYQMYQDGKLSLSGLENMAKLCGYELTDNFKKKNKR